MQNAKVSRLKRNASAFEAGFTPLTEVQKAAYSYLRAPFDESESRAKQQTVSLGQSMNSWSSNSRQRRNSVIGSQGNRKHSNVCKELIELDLHSSFQELSVGARDRVQSEYIARPSNPLATLFSKQRQ